MSDTLTEYAKLAKDEVLKGVYETLLTEDQLIPRLKFRGFTGNALVYNRELTLPTTQSHAVGDTWETTKPTFTKKTATLTTVGVQTGIDMYIKETRDNVQDPEALTLMLATKSFARKLAYYVIKAEPEAITTDFEGLDSLCRSEGRMMAMDDGDIDGPGTAETELVLDRLDAMIDMVEKGKPDVLIMNKTARRKLSALSRAAGSGVLSTIIDQFGHQVSMYAEIPIVISEWITNAEQYNDASSWPSSTATTIFAVKFGQEKQGYEIIHNGSVMTPRVRKLGVKRDEEVEEFRMVAYLQSVTYSPKMIAALGGIDSAL